MIDTTSATSKKQLLLVIKIYRISVFLLIIFDMYPKFSFRQTSFTANMYSGITVEVQLKNCTFEELQFLTVDYSSLYFLQVKNCNLSIIFNVVYFAWN